VVAVPIVGLMTSSTFSGHVLQPDAAAVCPRSVQVDMNDDLSADENSTAYTSRNVARVHRSSHDQLAHAQANNHLITVFTRRHHTNSRHTWALCLEFSCEKVDTKPFTKA